MAQHRAAFAVFTVFAIMASCGATSNLRIGNFSMFHDGNSSDSRRLQTTPTYNVWSYDFFSAWQNSVSSYSNYGVDSAPTTTCSFSTYALAVVQNSTLTGWTGSMTANRFSVYAAWNTAISGYVTTVMPIVRLYGSTPSGCRLHKGQSPLCSVDLTTQVGSDVTLPMTSVTTGQKIDIDISSAGWTFAVDEPYFVVFVTPSVSNAGDRFAVKLGRVTGFNRAMSLQSRTASGVSCPNGGVEPNAGTFGVLSPDSSLGAFVLRVGYVVPSPSPSPTTGGATASSTGSPTASETLSPSPSTTGTATSSLSPSGTGSLSASPTASPPASPSLSPSPSPTSSITTSASGSGTASNTASETGTLSASPSATPSLSPSPSPTSSLTTSATGSGTASNTASISSSPSATASRTATKSRSPSSTGSSTLSPSLSGTATRTSTPTQTATATATVSVSASVTGTASISGSATMSISESATASLTASASATVSASETSSVTPSMLSSPSNTETSSPSSSWTPSVTQTAQSTPTPIPSLGPSSSGKPVPRIDTVEIGVYVRGGGVEDVTSPCFIFGMRVAMARSAGYSKSQVGLALLTYVQDLNYGSYFEISDAVIGNTVSSWAELQEHGYSCPHWPVNDASDARRLQASPAASPLPPNQALWKAGVRVAAVNASKPQTVAAAVATTFSSADAYNVSFSSFLGSWYSQTGAIMSTETVRLDYSIPGAASGDNVMDARWTTRALGLGLGLGFAIFLVVVVAFIVTWAPVRSRLVGDTSSVTPTALGAKDDKVQIAGQADNSVDLARKADAELTPLDSDAVAGADADTSQGRAQTVDPNPAPVPGTEV